MFGPDYLVAIGDTDPRAQEERAVVAHGIQSAPRLCNKDSYVFADIIVRKREGGMESVDDVDRAVANATPAQNSRG